VLVNGPPNPLRALPVLLAALSLGPAALGADGDSLVSDQISARDLARALETNPSAYLLVDVRTRAEFMAKTGHIRGAQSLPFPSVMWRRREIRPSPRQTVVLVCHSAHRSRVALKGVHKRLNKTSSHEVLELAGGMLSWWEAKLPVVVAGT
jgi:rhodanese-related sulfurtransferase